MRDIRAFARRIAEEFKPQRIILFGSYAYGKPTEDSDVDLLVVMAYKGHPARQTVDIFQRVRHPSFPLDLIIRSPTELKKRLVLHDWFMWDIVERGRVLHGPPLADVVSGDGDLAHSRRMLNDKKTTTDRGKPALRSLTEEWVRSAEGSFSTALRLTKARKHRNDEAVCFHARQSAERYLKACLQEADLRFGKTQHLTELLDLHMPIRSDRAVLRDDLDALSIYDMSILYPGRTASKDDARTAFVQSRRIRLHARSYLGIGAGTSE